MQELHASPSLVRFLSARGAWHSAKSDALDMLHISLQKPWAVSCVSVQFLQSVGGDPMNAARR